jgi:hypothetical protein
MAGEPEWEGLFDFSKDGIQRWEVDQIRAAARDGSLRIDQHADRATRERDILLDDVIRTVRAGKAVEKTLPPHPDQAAGIAFEKSVASGRRIRVKVGFRYRRYAVVTAHDV